jgi:oligoendopeptidase F
MAVVDAFQNWAYTHKDAATNPDNCDQQWSELYQRYMEVDWGGLDEEMVTGWQRKSHIFEYRSTMWNMAWHPWGIPGVA